MRHSNFEIIDKCRISGSKKLNKILNLGNQPLANSLKNKQFDNEEKYPLSISFCEESSLLQLNETIKKEVLFDRYVWVTSTSLTARNYSEIFFHNINEEVALDKNNDLIIEIASNDGTFLKPFLKNGFKKVIGIEPAKNISDLAKKNNINTINSYWNEECATFLHSKFGKAKLVFARNVIPHVSELQSVISGVESILSEDGIGIFEIHDANIIFEELHYDSIYHEHLCFFTLKSISYLLKQFNLFPFEIKRSPISGGSFVIYFSKKEKPQSRNMELALINENKTKVNELQSWMSFASKVNNHKSKMRKILASYSGKKVIGFGSSARSQTFLNYCEFNQNDINLIIDNNPMKQNFYSPGSDIKIVDFNEGMRLNPDVVFILAWNFKDEIINQCKSAGYNGEYIVPFPKNPQIINI